MTTPAPRIVLRRAATLVLSGLALAGCGIGAPPVDRAEVESEIRTEYAAAMGETPQDVSCPQDLPAREDASMDCEVRVGAEAVTITATVSSVADGTVTFDLELAPQH